MKNGRSTWAAVVGLAACISATGAAAQDEKDDGICPPCARPKELQLYRDLVAITRSAVVIITTRNTRNSTAPRIVLDIEAKGRGCSWASNAGAQLQAIGKVIAASEIAADLPHLQYSIFTVKRDGERDNRTPSNRIIRMADLVDRVGAKEPGMALLARGRLMAVGETSLEKCLPRMHGGAEGESWEQMYGKPDPREEVKRKHLPVFTCLEAARSQAERNVCAELAR